MKQTIAIALAAALAVAATIARADATLEPRHSNRIALHATPAVVKIWTGWVGGFEVGALHLRGVMPLVVTGSGFFVSGDGYVVTNAHVARLVYEGQEAAEKKISQMIYEEVSQLPEVRNAPPERRDEILHSIRGTFVKRIADVQLPDGRRIPYVEMAHGDPDPALGQDVAILKVQIQNAPTLALGDSSNVQVDDELHAVGFPGAADFKHSIEGQRSALDDTQPIVASFTDGKVASVDQRASSGAAILQVTIPITHGNSGGPVVDQDGRVVGLATWGAVDRETHHEIAGFNFLVTSNVVKDYLRKAGAATSPSETDRVYQGALEHYFAGRWQLAIDALVDVKQLYPAHPEVDALTARAKDHVRNDQSGSLVGGLVVIGVLLALAGAAVVTIRGRKRTIAPQAQPQLVLGETMKIAPSTLAKLSCGTLVCVSGSLAAHRFEIFANGLVIGRDRGCDVAIPDGRVSKQHARIEIGAGRLTLVDCGSRNGTFVNSLGARVTRRDLQPGDQIIIGDRDCAVFVVEARVATPAFPRTTVPGWRPQA
jgi:S1-C subfamily serine protease